MVVSDTTPPPAVATGGNTSSHVMGPEFKALMGDMAVMFPKLTEPIQEQARQAHGHIQTLIHSGHYEQALSLMRHMKDIMKNLLTSSGTQQPLPFLPPNTFLDSPLTTGPSRVIEDIVASSPPPPPVVPQVQVGDDMTALKRTVEDLQMKMQGNSAITLIAKRVRDVELDQRYTTLEAQVREMRHVVENRLDRIRSVVDQAETMARIEAKKRTVSRNPFCEHGPAGECDFCVGKEFEDADFLVTKRSNLDSHAVSPPRTTGAASEDLVNREMILSMQNTLKTYQGMLKEMLEERKRELQIDRERMTALALNTSTGPQNGYSYSAPPQLGANYTKDVCLKEDSPNQIMSIPSTNSLWKVVHSQQQQINEVQRRLDELSGMMRTFKSSSLETPSICDSYGGISPNYKAKRREVKSTAETSFISEWDSIQKKRHFSKFKPLPAPYDESESEEEDESQRRIESLIKKYTNLPTSKDSLVAPMEGDSLVSRPPTAGLAEITKICHYLKFHKIDELFAPIQRLIPETDDHAAGQCSTCNESGVFGDHQFGVHMYLLVPGDRLHVHGSGLSMREAREMAGINAIQLLLSLEPEILTLKRARLRARLKDFGCTVPKSDAMKLLESAATAADGGDEVILPQSFLDLLELVSPPEQEGECTKKGDEIEIGSEKFLDSVSFFTPEEVENVLTRIGLTLIEELNGCMNVFIYISLVKLSLQLPIQRLIGEDKMKLSFLKIFEQLIMFNSAKYVGGNKLVGKLLRHFLSERAIPFIAKNRMDILAVQYSTDGPGTMKIYDSKIRSHESEDSMELEKIIESKMPPKEYLELLFSEFRKINEKIRSLFDVDGQIYGSLVNGFPTNSSDIDVVINLPNEEHGGEDAQPDEDEVDGGDTGEGQDEQNSGDGGVGVKNRKILIKLNLLADSIASSLPEFEISKIETARVPILKCKSKITNVEIDISFNHEVVVLNSALLRAYSNMSPRVRQLVVLVKHWAKQRELNDALQGTLSSYSYVLLVIHYLQRRGFLPDLQKPPAGQPIPMRMTDGGRCSTWYREESELVKYGEIYATEISRLNACSLKNLFLKFFEYFLYDFNFIVHVAAISSAVPTPEGTIPHGTSNVIPKIDLFRQNSDSLTVDWRTMRRRTWLTILDPFELNRFLGTTARGTEIMVKEMRRAVDLLREGSVVEIFESFKRKDIRSVGTHVPIRNLSNRDKSLSGILIPIPVGGIPVNRVLHLTSIPFCQDMIEFLNSVVAELQQGDGVTKLNEVRALMALSPLGLIPENFFKSLSVSFSDIVGVVELGAAVVALRQHLQRLEQQDRMHAQRVNVQHHDPQHPAGPPPIQHRPGPPGPPPPPKQRQGPPGPPPRVDVPQSQAMRDIMGMLRGHNISVIAGPDRPPGRGKGKGKKPPQNAQGKQIGTQEMTAVKEKREKKQVHKSE